MEQKQKNTSAGNSTNPVSQKQGVNPVTASREKAKEALIHGAFFAMWKLNGAITLQLVDALLDYMVSHRDDPHPIETLEKEPSQAIWSCFFQAYREKATVTDSNSRNPQQSFRNMLSSFPAKAKAVMVALNEAGLPTNWIMPKNSKRISFSQEDEKEINDLLQKSGILNPSMDIASRYKVFKALGGRLTSRAKKQQ